MCLMASDATRIVPADVRVYTGYAHPSNAHRAVRPCVENAVSTYICGGCCIGGCEPPDFLPFSSNHAATTTTTAITIYHHILDMLVNTSVLIIYSVPGRQAHL